MSFSLKIAGGDLVMEGSHMAIVANVDKLKQDMTLWLTERYGIDRFHPEMGSNFQNYIGGIVGYGTQAKVRQEAERVLDNYMKVQRRGFREAPGIYSLSELLNNVNSVNVGVSYDTLSVAVMVSNAVRQSTTIQVVQGA